VGLVQNRIFWNWNKKVGFGFGYESRFGEDLECIQSEVDGNV